MSSRPRNYTESGFTAVELLVTLLVASVFLFAGYQLYVQVMRDGAQANRTATLSNLVNERLQEEVSATSSQSSCTASSTKDTTSSPTNLRGLVGVTFRTQVTCPSGTMDLYHIKITGAYNDNGTQRTVQHATFTN